MLGYQVYINVPDYVAQYVVHHFGNPVQLRKYTIEYKILKEYLTRQPDNCTLDKPDDFNLHIALPYFKDKDPRVYFYLSEKSKKVLAARFEVMFEINMWTELLPTLNTKSNTTDIIYAFLERHGIDPDQHENVRQKFYRLRKKYFENNDITLG